MASRIATWIILLSIVFGASPAKAPAQAETEGKAFFCFDLRLDDIFDDEMIRLMLPKFLSNYANRTVRDFPAEVAKRIYGGYCPDPGLKFPMRDTPGNLRVHFQTHDENGVAVLNDFFSLKDETETIGGRKLKRSGRFPMELYVEQLGPREICLCSRGYVNEQTLAQSFSPSLREAWKKQNAKIPFRISVGVKENPAAIDTILKRIERVGTPDMVSFYSVLKNADAANLTWNPDATKGEELFSLQVFGAPETSSAAAQRAVGGVKNWLGNKRSIFQLLKEKEVGARYTTEFLDGLKVVDKKGVATIVVPTPESSSELHQRMLTFFRFLSSHDPMNWCYRHASEFEKKHGQYPFASSDEQNWRDKILELKTSSGRNIGPDPSTNYMPEVFGAWSPHADFVYVPHKEFAGKQWSKDQIANPQQTIMLMRFAPPVKWRSKDNPTIDQLVNFVKTSKDPHIHVFTYDGNFRAIKPDIPEAALGELLSAGAKTIEDLGANLHELKDRF